MYKLGVPNKVDTRTWFWMIFFIVFSSLFALAYTLAIPSEDAVILYEYAKNLSHNGIITYGGNSLPIEGATDFLWMILIAALKWMGVDEFGSSLFLNFAAVFLIARIFKEDRDKILFGIATLLTPYLYSSLNGFSAIFFSASYTWALHLLFSKSKYFYAALLACCLIRPDGVVWGIGCVLLRMLEAHGTGDLKDDLRLCAIWLVTPGLTYFAWRLWYFEEIFPLSFIVKSTSLRDFFIFYKRSIISVMAVAAPLFFTLIVFTREKGKIIKIAFLFAAPILFYSAMRLEQNVGNRFMAPLFFGAFFVLSRLFERRALLLFSVMSVLTQLPWTIHTAAAVSDSSRETVYYLSKDLDSLDGRMLVTEAGRLPYYSNWFGEDSWGLNTPRYAKRLITKNGVAEGKYDLIVAHCDLSMLKDEVNLFHDSSRSWENQCKALISHLREGQFEIYLVPFLKKGLTQIDSLKVKLGISTSSGENSLSCMRHDIYAISRTYKNSRELALLLQKHRGFVYSKDTKTTGDLVCQDFQ